MLSIWEKEQFIHYDAAIIGGGIVGLCSAFYLKQKYPSWKIAVLERGLLPTGASTKNAGFACMGSPTELLDDLNNNAEEEVLNLFLLRKKGLERLQSLLGKDKIGYQANGSYELLFEQDIDVLERLDNLNQLLFKELQQNAFSSCSEKINEFGFHGIQGMIENHCEGEINTGMMMSNLSALVRSQGIEIITGCEVKQFQEEEKQVLLFCSGIQQNELIFKTKQLLICNNAFANTLLPGYDVVPGRGQVLITKPIDKLRFKGIFHFQQGYYYFREYNGRILFGGGRQLDFEKERTTAFESNASILADLNEKLQSIILPGQGVDIDYNWTGIMAFGKTKKPIIQPHSPRIHIGIRMGGMGVAIGSEVGFRLCEMVALGV